MEKDVGLEMLQGKEQCVCPFRSISPIIEPVHQPLGMNRSGVNVESNLSWLNVFFLRRDKVSVFFSVLRSFPPAHSSRLRLADKESEISTWKAS